MPGESAGTLPSQEWKMRRFRQKWFPRETISVGIGQGYNAYTPLQLAAAIATLANDGVMLRPRLAAFVEDVRTRERTPIESKPVRTLDLKPEYIKIVKDALVDVNKEGTAQQAFAGAEYVSAGKTGTAQVIGIKQGEKYIESRVEERLRDHSLYIAYAPADKPAIALAVIVENGGFGSRAAAPIARKVLDYFLRGKESGIVNYDNGAASRLAYVASDTRAPARSAGVDRRSYASSACGSGNLFRTSASDGICDRAGIR